jgi:hypothetical protein
VERLNGDTTQPCRSHDTIRYAQRLGQTTATTDRVRCT